MTESIYFNEIDSFAAQWLRNLFHSATIDERSIRDVTPDDLRRFYRCHFFAGIGGWEFALQLANWPHNRPVWTGSCPCQPYSSAGKGEGDKDARNLWPDFFRLIRECRPDTIFGEQVASAIGHGWLDGIQRDLEGEGYAVGHCVLGAHSVGSPHIRQRLYWVANNQSKGFARVEPERSKEIGERSWAWSDSTDGRCSVAYTDEPIIRGIASAWKQSEHEQNGGTGRLADGASGGRGVIGDAAQSRHGGHVDGGSEVGGMGEPKGEREGAEPRGQREGVLQPRGDGGLGIASLARLQGHAGNVEHGHESGRNDAGQDGPIAAPSAWADSISLECTDGRSRRISAEPGDEPLAYGVPVKLGPIFSWMGGLERDATPVTRMARLARRNRTGRLRGYGNAIVPQLAAEFIMAFLESEK